MSKRTIRNKYIAVLTVTVTAFLLCIMYVPKVWRHMTFMSAGPFDSISNLSDVVHNNASRYFIAPFPSCPEQPVKLMIFICSAVPNYVARQAIRESWGKQEYWGNDTVLYFILGRTYDNLTDAFVNEERLDHADVIQYNFMDTYLNLTLKTFMVFEWVHTICNRTEFVMKIDDDTFVHPINLKRSLEFANNKRLLTGILIDNAAPIRNFRDKWYMPEDIYGDDVYPNYLSGSGYLMSSDVIPLLHRNALRMPFFRFEDLFFTGFCAKASNLTPVDHSKFTYDPPRFENPCVFNDIVTSHRFTADKMKSIWQTLSDENSKC